VSLRVTTPLTVLVVAVAMADLGLRDPLLHTEHAAAAIVAALAATLLYMRIARRRRTVSRRMSTVAIAVFSLFWALLVAEAALTLIDRSDGIRYSLAGDLWFKRHWQPINSLGYRDREYSRGELEQKKKIYVIGASFVAGHGLKDYRDTFSQRLQLLVGDNSLVLNMGVCGDDSRGELKRLTQAPVKPDLIVLGYSGNDIIGMARHEGSPPPPFQPYRDLPAPLRAIVEHSYLFNFVLWSTPRHYFSDRWSYLKRVYEDPRILRLHAEDLQRFVDYSVTQQIPLAVVLFPYLHDLPGSSIYVPFVKAFFQTRGIPVLDVAELVADLPLRERVVNLNDLHPSITVHAMVADALFRLLREHSFL
jgi:hypothetical protein